MTDEFYIKDRKTFRTKCTLILLTYEMVPWSIYDENSTFTVKRKEYYCDIVEGDILCAGEYIGIIKDFALEGETFKLICEHILKMFNRDLIFTEEQYTYVEDWVKSKIDANFTNQSDSMYRLPYLDVKVLTHTTSWMNPDVEEGVWNIKSFVAKIRRLQSIFTEFSYTRDNLTITIGKKQLTPKQIDLSGGQYIVEEETYSNTAIGRITSVLENDETPRQIKEWYILLDGTVVNTYTSENRVNGSWEVLFIENAEDIETSVRNEFAKNSSSHKIQFSVPLEMARFSFYDDVTIRGRNGRISASYIAAIRKKKGDSRVIYQCGELRTLGTDKTKGEM